MDDVNSSEIVKDDNAFLNSIDLDKDVEKIYELIGDEDLQDEFEEQAKLTRLRNENHRRYYNINTIKYRSLPHELDDVVDDIFKFYNCIDKEEILNCNLTTSKHIQIILNNIYRRIERLDRMVKSYLKDLTKKNDENQAKFSHQYFKNLDIDETLKRELIDKYNNLILYSSYITEDIYEDLKRQVVRESLINEILKILNIEEDRKETLLRKDKLKILNSEIDKEIQKYKKQIQYLEDLMPNESEYLENFKSFKDFCNKIFAYDDTNYNNARQTYDILSDELRFQAYFTNFEEMFIQEVEKRKKEQKFIFEKVGIKNLRNSLNYIVTNYTDKLDEESNNIIDYIYNKLNQASYDLNDLNQALKLVVRRIWAQTITDVYEYNPNEDFYFICSNNPFIDERYQTILITNKEISKVNDYEDYQIGFICKYCDNILYITENDDIMTVNDDDMSNLKTPFQLEDEFMNFKVCNRIALDGFRTKLEAVYYINDGNKDKYLKALDLANMYKLPLIEIKKD